MHWVRRGVKATVGGVERRADSQKSGAWQEKTNYIHDVTKPTVFADVFKKDAAVMIGEGGTTS